MERILLIALKWLLKKLVILACILAVMVGALWLRHHWKGIEHTKEKLAEARERADKAREELARRKGWLEEAKAKYQGDLDRLADFTTKDTLGEVGIVELPEGAAMVLHPRALAGVVKPAAGSTRITRHWRLLNLHSWLTLQLRYLVFHGPCSVILKGCRGVRAESPDPASPRLLNQSATLGFSSHLDYSNSRCETFWPYFRGKEDLFNDLFGGENGLYVYEEMPDARRKAGLAGRGLEGLLDGFLKVFGI
jgi:hypothetical protein